MEVRKLIPREAEESPDMISKTELHCMHFSNSLYHPDKMSIELKL